MNKIKKVEENDKNESLEKNTPMLRAYSGYDGDVAVDYARKYWKNYNSDYDKYSADCTNFVSQCIHAGGISTTSKWNKNTTKWIRVIELYDYLVSNNIAKEYSWSSNCKEGDIIQLYNKNKSIITTIYRFLF